MCTVFSLGLTLLLNRGFTYLPAHNGPEGGQNPQNQLTWFTFNDWFLKTTCSDELRTLFILSIRSFLGSQDSSELKRSLKLCPKNMPFSKKKVKKLFGHLKKWICLIYATALNFNTPCHIFFIETVIEAKKNEKMYFLGIFSCHFLKKIPYFWVFPIFKKLKK